MFRMRDYVAIFIRVYKEQAAKLQEKDKAFFGRYLEGQTLSEPCQAEVAEFYKPYRMHAAHIKEL